MAARRREEIYQRSQDRIDGLFDRISARFQKTVEELRTKPLKQSLEEEFEPTERDKDPEPRG